MVLKPTVYILEKSFLSLISQNVKFWYSELFSKMINFGQYFTDAAV